MQPPMCAVVWSAVAVCATPKSFLILDLYSAGTDDELQAFGFIYRDPLNDTKSYLCNFCNFISPSRKDFMQHSFVHVVQCGSCSFKAFTRLEVSEWAVKTVK